MGFKLSAALNRYRFVTVGTTQQLEYCGVGGLCVGSLQESAPDNVFPIGSIVGVAEIEPGCEVLFEAGETLVPGDLFKPGANGVGVKDASKTVDTLGKVLVGAGVGEVARGVFGK